MFEMTKKITVMMAAILQNTSAINYCHPEILEKVFIDCIREKINIQEHLSIEFFKKQDPSLLESIVSVDGLYL